MSNSQNITKKRVAIVGYGGMGCWHRSHILESDVCELAGIYDIREERCELARERGIYVYDSFEAVLADETVEIVTVVVPNDKHMPLVKAALEAGKNVVCEKPVAMNSVELDEMITTAEKCGKENRCNKFHNLQLL